MKAMTIERFGGPEVFQASDLPEPAQGPGRALVKVAATSVNPIDAKIRARGMGLCPPFPAILHGDLSGIIVAIGEGVEAFAPGDAVFGCVGGAGMEQGALAQLVSVDARLLAKKPRSLSYAEAAALPIVGLTALRALRDRAALREGESLLVLGAAGGVGHIALQLGKAMGASITGTASAGKLGHLRELGSRAFDYREGGHEAALLDASGGKGYDLVFDTVGGSSLDLAFRLAKSGGRVAAVAARSTHDLSPLHGKGLSLHVIFSLLPILTGEGRREAGRLTADLAELADRGELRPRLDARRFVLEEAGAAHALWESGDAKGKIVIAVDPALAMTV
ncbi:MAG: zinc-dependent alcohol dehydrogenase family protein [Spirochaetaceae bacterium]|nr:zinc-dependent alcohol dehydrogenase family protein [Spirochaetaceae bacterium]